MSDLAKAPIQVDDTTTSVDGIKETNGVVDISVDSISPAVDAQLSGAHIGDNELPGYVNPFEPKAEEVPEAAKIEGDVNND